MTEKFIGSFKFDDSNPAGGVLLEKSLDKIPDKKEWSNFSIFEFNGRQYRPVTHKAENNINDVIKQFNDKGFTKAVKSGKRKPSSIKYAIQTYGIEPFTFA